MKKILSLFLILCVIIGIFSAIPVSALTLTYGDFIYNILEDGTLEAATYKGDDIDVIISSTVRGYDVTALGADLFNENTEITSITFPKSVTTCGENTFNFDYIESFTFEEGTKTVFDATHIQRVIAGLV